MVVVELGGYRVGIKGSSIERRGGSRLMVISSTIAPILSKVVSPQSASAKSFFLNKTTSIWVFLGLHHLNLIPKKVLLVQERSLLQRESFARGKDSGSLARGLNPRQGCC